MLIACLASLLVLSGPPALPPVPGEAAITPEPVAAPQGDPAPTGPAPAVVVQTPTTPGPAATPTPAAAVPAPESPVVVAPPQPADVAGPPASAPVAASAPVTAPAPVYDVDLHAPPPPVHINAPHYRGRGLLVGAAVVGAAGLGIRGWATYEALQWRDPLSSMVLGLLHNPLIGASMGMLGGGMAIRGRHDAHRYLFEGRPARTRRTILGWSLFGAGSATWLATRVYGAMGCRNTDCMIAVWESGYYLSLAATVPGVIMGAYGSGFEGYVERFGHFAPQITVTPMASRDTWGLSLTGRF